MVINASDGASVRYEVRGDLPTGKHVVAIETPTGVVMVVRAGKITSELLEELHELHDALFALGVLEQPQEE